METVYSSLKQRKMPLSKNGKQLGKTVPVWLVPVGGGGYKERL
jgi:hypothetical protein